VPTQGERHSKLTPRHWTRGTPAAGEWQVSYFLRWQRGLNALLSLAKEPDIDLRIAGEGAPDIVATLKANPSVTYLGFLTSQEILEETKRCHFVPVLYDPSRIINRFAASNKLAEALSTGRPVILNDELEVAKELTDATCVIRVSYTEAGDISSRLRTIVKDPAQYAEACADARRIYDAHYNWEKAKMDSLSALLGEGASVPVRGGQQYVENYLA
jgi:glycosyltransferase involved in cell wall biosynthesis